MSDIADPNPAAETPPAPAPVETPPAPQFDAEGVPTSLEGITDPDLIELFEAREAEKAERQAAETAGQESTGTEGAPQPAPAGQPQPTPAQQPDDTAPMIPKARFDEVLAREREARAQLERLQAGTQQPPAPQPQRPAAPPQPSAEDQIAALERQSEELAAKYDAGDLSMAEFKRQENQLGRQVHAVRERALTEQMERRAAESGDALFLEQQTKTLEAKHPFMNTVTQNDMDVLSNMAVRELTQEGLLDPNAPITASVRLQVRERIGALSDRYGPMMTGKPAATPAPAAQRPQAPNLPTAADRARKMDMQETFPPNVAGMTGAGGDDPAGITKARLETMTDEEIDALPTAVMAKFGYT